MACYYFSVYDACFRQTTLLDKNAPVAKQPRHIQKVFLFLKFIKFLSIARRSHYAKCIVYRHAQHSSSQFHSHALWPLPCLKCGTTQMRSSNFTFAHRSKKTNHSKHEHEFSIQMRTRFQPSLFSDMATCWESKRMNMDYKTCEKWCCVGFDNRESGSSISGHSFYFLSWPKINLREQWLPKQRDTNSSKNREKNIHRLCFFLMSFIRPLFFWVFFLCIVCVKSKIGNSNITRRTARGKTLIGQWTYRNDEL